MARQINATDVQVEVIPGWLDDNFFRRPEIEMVSMHGMLQRRRMGESLVRQFRREI